MSTARAVPTAKWQGWLTHTALSLGHVAVLFNAGAYIAMLPRVAGSLGVAPSFGTWTQTDFMIALAIGFPLAGALSRRYGDARVASGAYAAFALASLGCALAEELAAFLACRIVLGLSGGIALPVSQKLALGTVSERHKPLGLALWGLFALTPFTVGTTLGGWLADEHGWRWLFWSNIPIALLALQASIGSLPPSAPTAATRLDWTGFLLVSGVLMGTQNLLNLGNDFDWLNADEVMVLTLITGFCLPWAILHLLRQPDAFVDLRVLRSRNVAIALLALSLGFLGFQGLLSLLIVQLQLLLGYSSQLAGMVFLPMLLLSKPASIVAHQLSSRMDARWLASASLFGFALTYFWISRYDQPASFDQILWPKLAEGLCLGSLFAPLTVILLHGVAAAQQPRVMELVNLLRLASGAFGITLAGVVLYRRTPFHQSRFVERLTLLDPQTPAALERLIQQGFSPAAAEARLARTVTQHAAIFAIDEAFWLAGWLFVGLGMLVWLAQPTRPVIRPQRAENREVAFENLMEEP